MVPITSVRELVTPLGLSLGVANVLMQLSLPGVGYGVVDSPVESGRVDLHPVKRARTTATFLAVAVVGDEADRAYLHEVLHSVHAQVRSGPGEKPKYSANSPDLQMWVALCLVKYYVDQYEMVHRRLDDQEFAAVLRDGMPLGTTLEVSPKAWPTSRGEYEELWQRYLERLEMDDKVRDFLRSLADLSLFEQRLGLLGTAMHHLLGWRIEYLARAGLPDRFRSMLGYRWSPADERSFRYYRRSLRVVDTLTPGVWLLPSYAVLWDMRIRRRLGMRVV